MWPRARIRGIGSGQSRSFRWRSEAALVARDREGWWPVGEEAPSRDDETKVNSLRGWGEKNETFFSRGWQWWVISLQVQGQISKISGRTNKKPYFLYY
jgi:hypothetical protein